MRTPLRIWIAGMAAALVQPLVQAVLQAGYLFGVQSFAGTQLILLFVFGVAAVGVFLLGVPAFLLLRRMGRLGWRSVSIAGMLLGALPLAVFAWPGHEAEGALSAGQNWHGRYVDTYVAGTPSTYGWLVYGESILGAAAMGLLSALVFYAVWRRLGHVRPG
jgi:hypothetical protein